MPNGRSQIMQYADKDPHRRPQSSTEATINMRHIFALLICIVIGIAITKTGSSSSASSQELTQIIQGLWNADVNRLVVGRDIQLRLQSQVELFSDKDAASDRLFKSVKSLTSKSTYKILLALLDNYEPYTHKLDTTSSKERAEQKEFVTSILKTEVWQLAKKFLVNQALITDEGSLPPLLDKIWFTEYSRANGVVGSSGFEHVFSGELNNKKKEISGLHGWLSLYQLEKQGAVNYKGYIKYNAKIQLYELKLQYGNLRKHGSSMFIGTSPEFDMAVYTICFLVKPNASCAFKLNGQSLAVQTYTSYNGALSTAYPRF